MKPKIFFTPSHDTEFHQAAWHIDNKQISAKISSPTHDNMLQTPHHLHSSLSLKRILLLNSTSTLSPITTKFLLIIICFNPHTIYTHPYRSEIICFLRPQQPSRHVANRHQILACHVLDFHQHPNNITYPDKNINGHLYYITLFVLKMVPVAGTTNEAIHSSTWHLRLHST